MARTRTLVEKDLQKATSLVKAYEAKLGAKPQKKALRKDPKWRRLNAVVSKFKRQLGFIDKRNKKPEASA